MANGKLSENQELDYINTINEQLKNYEDSIKLINEKSNYPQIIINGSEITELMLELILKKESYKIIKSISIIKYSINTNLIPDECIKPLLIINRIKNMVKRSETITINQVHDFLKSFKCFITWFDENYQFKNENHVFMIEKCCDLIDHITKNENTKTKTPLITGSDPIYINKIDELLCIHEINNTLRKLQKHVELISEDNYSGSVIEGHKLCVSMLELYLKKEGYEVENHQVLFNDKRMLIIPFCSRKDILPEECQRFLDLIKKYRNEFVHLNPSYELATSFLSALSYFIIWFNNFYSEKFNVEKPFKVEDCYKKINSISKTKPKIKLLSSEISSLETYDYCLRKDLNATLFLHKKTNQPLNIFEAPNDVIIKQLYQKTIGIEKKLEELERISRKIETKLDELYKGLSSQITTYQSLIEKQLKKTSTPEDLDMIIEGYVDECVERITEHNEKISKEKSYKLEKRKLIRSFGEDAWNKLS